jgi:hypothetical protein
LEVILGSATSKRLKNTGVNYYSIAGVANLFHKRAEIWHKKAQRANIFIETILAGQDSTKYNTFIVIKKENYYDKCLKLSSRAIKKVFAGQKWPAGLALATPALLQGFPIF